MVHCVPTRRVALAWAALVLTAVFLVVDVLDVVANGPTIVRQPGVDYRLYVDAASRWLSGGGYFQAYQLNGPYQISAGDILYPPIALLLFVLFTTLPAILWWLIPAGAVAWSLIRLRPVRRAWPLSPGY